MRADSSIDPEAFEPGPWGRRKGDVANPVVIARKCSGMAHVIDFVGRLLSRNLMPMYVSGAMRGIISPVMEVVPLQQVVLSVSDKRRLICGFLLPPVIPALIFAVGTPWINGDPDKLWTLGLLPVCYPFALMAMFVLGGPLFFLGNKFNLVRWWSASLCGALAGVISFVAFGPAWSVAEILHELSSNGVLFWAATGAATGLAFWFILWIGNPRA